MHGLTRRGAVVAGFLLPILAGITSSRADSKVVKIGMLVGLSGPGAEIGESIVRGAELYVDLHKQTLPAGTTVELVKRDDGSNPDRTKRLAQELVIRDKVQLLAGVTLSPQALTLAPVSTEAKVPTLILNATTGSLTRASPYFVRFSYANWQMAYTVGAWAAKHGIKSAYTLVADYAAGLDMEAGFRRGFEESGGTIVGSDHAPVATTDYLPAMVRIKAAAPKALFIFTIPGAATVATLKAFRDSGLQAAGVQLLGTGVAIPDSELAETGGAALGMIDGSIYSAFDPAPANARFVAAWRKAYGPNAFPDLPGVAAWNAMDAVFALIAKHGADFTADQAMTFLSNWSAADTPAGRIAIDPATRDIVHSVSISRITKVGDHYENAPSETLANVKDAWKELNPAK